VGRGEACLGNRQLDMSEWRQKVRSGSCRSAKSGRCKQILDLRAMTLNLAGVRRGTGSGGRVRTWWVYDEDGEVVDSVEAETVADAIGQFAYAESSWFGVPDGWSAIPSTALNR
jgi:hypothetical protein